MKEQKTSKIIRSLLFIFFLLTVLFTLLSGIGTYCAAFETEKYPSMSALLPYQWLYQILVIVSVTVGLWGLWVTISFIRSKANVYRNVIIFLCIGLGAAAVQMITSEIARGNSVPVNFRVYFTLFTLLLFLLVRYTPLWQRSGFSQTKKKSGLGMAAIGSALFVGGIVILTTHIWVGSSHFAGNGYNWVNDLRMPLDLSGLGMIFSGAALLFISVKRKMKDAKESILLADRQTELKQN